VYPLIISVGISVLSIVLLVLELRKQKAGKSEGPVKFALGNEGKLVAFVSVMCLLYAIAFDALGYMLATFLFIEAIMLFISKAKKMLIPTLWALGFSVGVYYLFGKVLAITLPKMPFLNL
jgi:putative tricarboxylic transport membrane protein